MLFLGHLGHFGANPLHLASVYHPDLGLREASAPPPPPLKTICFSL